MQTERPVMDEKTIDQLAKDGDASRLAQALRNIIKCTDEATHAAQAAANARQEYVPTVVYKDALYQAMDTALRDEPYQPGGYGFATEEMDEFAPDLPEPDPADETDYRPLALWLMCADQQWDMQVDHGDIDPDSENYWAFVAQFTQHGLDVDKQKREQPPELRSADQLVEGQR